MSTAEITRRPTEESARTRTKYVGIYYLLTIFTGAFVLSFHGRLAFAADFVVSAFYITLTAFFYGMSKPAQKR
jgi:hypothetical protein